MPTFTYVEDRGMEEAVTPKVFNAQFGDGYSQRLSNSINPLQKEFSPRFANRKNSDADAIVAFFEARLGAESFDWTPSGYTASIKVICPEWSATWTSPETKTVTAKFIRVYEA